MRFMVRPYTNPHKWKRELPLSPIYVVLGRFSRALKPVMDASNDCKNNQLTRSSSPRSWSLGNPIHRILKTVNKKSRYSPSLPRASPSTFCVTANKRTAQKSATLLIPQAVYVAGMLTSIPFEKRSSPFIHTQTPASLARHQRQVEAMLSWQ